MANKAVYGLKYCLLPKGVQGQCASAANISVTHLTLAAAAGNYNISTHSTNELRVYFYFTDVLQTVEGWK